MPTSTVNLVHVELSTGRVITSRELNREDANKLAAELNSGMLNPEAYPVVDVRALDGLHTLASAHVVHFWKTTREIGSDVLDGGRP